MAASEESTVPSSPAEKLGLAPQSDHDLHHAPSDPDRSLETALSEELLQLLLKEAENGEAGGQWRDSVDGNGESDETDVPIGTEVAVPLEEENGETGGEWSDGAGKHGKSDEIGSEDGPGSERGGGESVGDDDDDDDRVCEWRERGKEERERGLGSGMNLYPLRPEAEDCAYYMKTGSCKFGSCCKFNHPVRRKSHEKVKDKDDLMEKPGQTECKYYSRTGGCRFGKACRYSHPRAKVSTTPLVELNFLGLPIRPGEKECPYYMRTGSCKYASNCRYNHPDPTAVGGGNIVAGGGNIVAGYGNSRPASLQSPSQPVPAAPWSPTGTLKEPAPFMPPVYPPMQGVSSQNTEWNAYRVPVYPPERRVLPPPAFMVKSPTAESNIYSSDKKQMTIDEFPERPGQPDCSFYLKTGDCKFRSNCKYHHPRNRIPSLSSPVPLSDKGLPLRPGQNVCSYYSRYGICKFGPACRYDHPVNWTPSNVSAPYSGFTGPGSARMVGSNNGSDIIIQQSM